MTRALDTNIIVRVLADRSSPQLAAAEQEFETPFVIPLSVFLESEWVLRSVFRWNRHQIAESLRSLLDLPALASAPVGSAWILDRYQAGADFADMVHLASCGDATCFVTFDADVEPCAGPATPIKIETLA